MTENDRIYISLLLAERCIAGPVLELGAGYGGATCRDLVQAAGMRYFATDLHPSENVDFVANFEEDDVTTVFPDTARFNSILVLNVLEHTFNPVQILDNATKLLTPDGALVVIAPAVWGLHKFPIDCYRFLPDWYERYAESRRMIIDSNYFEYLGHGLLSSHRDREGNYELPRPTSNEYKYWKSRILQRVFDTYGRGMRFPSYVAIGAVLRNQKNSH